jgi:hypothetical protein
VNEGLMLPAKHEKLDDKVWRLNEAIQKAVKEVLSLACMPNKLWTKASTLLLAKEKREMKQRRQESNEQEKECRKLCHAVRKAARTDKEN